MAEHNTLTGSSLHEPKNIDSAATSDAGKVLTPSSTTAGTGELRNLVETEINSKTEYVVAQMDDISTAASIYLVAPFDGSISKVWSVINGAITGADATLTVKINGTNVSPATMTITQSGSAAGDVDSVTPTSLNTFSEGDYIEVATDGGSTGTVISNLTFKLARD